MMSSLRRSSPLTAGELTLLLLANMRRLTLEFLRTLRWILTTAEEDFATGISVFSVSDDFRFLPLFELLVTVSCSRISILELE
jgi:hypothetical protein